MGAMPTAGASWIQECGAVAASLSLTSLFPHSGVIESVASSGPVCPGTDSPASHNNNLATIIEDENKVGNSNIVGNKENEGYFDDNYAEENGRAIEIVDRKEEAKTRRRRKKKTASSTSLASNTFHELYRLTGEMLGQGAYASVRTCVNIFTEWSTPSRSLIRCPHIVGLGFSRRLISFIIVRVIQTSSN